MNAHHRLLIWLVRQYASTVVLGSGNSSRLVLHLFSKLVPKFSTLVLGTDNSSRLVFLLFSAMVRQYLSTQYRRLITACSSFDQCTRALVPSCLVQTTHQGLFFICLVHQYVSTLVIGTDDSSWLVLHLFSALIRQYLSTRYGRLIMACSSFLQCSSTLVIGTDDLSRLVLHLCSALVRQYLNTRYGRVITACSSFVQCARTLVHQYSVQTPTTACSSFVWCTSTLVLQYSVRITHHSLSFICLVRQYVSTVVFGTDDSQLVLHLFGALVRYYCSTRHGRLITACSSFYGALVLQCRRTWYGQLITACSSFLWCTRTLVLQ